jgi:hypothetical protein
MIPKNNTENFDLKQRPDKQKGDKKWLPRLESILLDIE